MKTCDVCGKEFYGSRVNQVTCSPSCRLKKWKAKHETHKQYFERTCRGCKTEFKTTNREKTFCTRACHVKWHNAQRPTTQKEDRKCVVCGTIFKPMQVRGVGRKWCSKECRLTILRDYKPKREKKKKRAREVTREWIKQHGGHRTAELKRRHGMTVQQYEDMLEKQGGVCAICKKPETITDKRNGKVRALAIDHCHKKGHVRQLLCTHCNQGIGNFLEDPAIMRAAIAYLNQHQVGE